MAILHGNRPAILPDIGLYPEGGRNTMPTFAHERAIRMAADACAEAAEAELAALRAAFARMQADSVPGQD